MSAFIDRQLQRLRRKLEASSVFLGVISEAYLRDPYALLQLGMAVVLDKPIVMIVLPGTTVPENLRRLAQQIEVLDSPEDLELAVTRLVARFNEGRA